jgi:tetratricopeptide (TPR) repeat protein
LFKLGRAYEATGAPRLAVDAYTQALRLSTFETGEVGASNVLVRLASLYRVEFTDPDKALALADQALALNKFGTRPADQAQAYYLQGEIGSQQGRDPSYCIERYQRALEAYPDHYWANLMLGWEYYRAGQSLDSAVNQMHDAISLQPKNEWGYLILAGLYAEVGNLAEARQYYEQVLRLDPANWPASQFLQNNPPK